MAKKKTTENDKTLLSKEQQLKTLKASYEMYEKSKIETVERRKNAKDKNGNRIYTDGSLDETLNLIETMQKDIKDRYVEAGGNPEELYVAPKKGRKKSVDRDKLQKLMKEQMEKELEEQNSDSDFTTYAEEEKVKDEIDIESLVDKDIKPEPVKEVEIPKRVKDKVEDNTKEEETYKLGDINMDVSKSIGKNIKYDVIPIPSGGKPYKHKVGKIPVAYLTAFDENMIMSPNLYQDGTFLDHIIKSKIMTTKIDTDDLLPGDREAILLWLRASAYGPLYPITATDKETGKSFQVDFDLTKLKYKKFNLKADENGYFDYKMPSTGDEIKFKFLSYKEVNELTDLTIKEDASLRKVKLKEIFDNISSFMEEDKDMSKDIRNKLDKSLDAIKEYGESITVDVDMAFNHLVTNRMSKNIVSVNGVTDRKFIDEYISFLNLRDATMFRRYIIDNEPGIDMTISVERPESLGGGSINLFLTIDQYLFLNFKNPFE